MAVAKNLRTNWGLHVVSGRVSGDTPVVNRNKKEHFNIFKTCGASYTLLQSAMVKSAKLSEGYPLMPCGVQIQSQVRIFAVVITNAAHGRDSVHCRFRLNHASWNKKSICS